MEDLENLIEKMIKEGDLKAKIKGDSLIFEDILFREEREIFKEEIKYLIGTAWI